MAEVLTLGVSHKTAPLELRERLALTEGRAVSVLGELVGAPGISEAAAISTCNRTELYLFASDPVGAESHALSVLARVAETRPTELVSHLYSLRGGEAAEQLYRVTAGLDSMIVGEAEVQGQVKRAYELALVEDATGPILNRMFRGALAAGKRARTETAISEGALSVPQVAVELAQRTLGDLEERSVLVIGAGETAELTARALAARGVDAIFIANRHYDRAIGLAERFGGRAVRFEELPGLLVDADIVVSSTSSPHHVIERESLAEVMPERDGAPAAADRPGGPARHPPLVPRARRRHGSRHGRPAVTGGAQHVRPRGGGPSRRADPGRGAGPVPGVALGPGGDADGGGAPHPGG